MLANGYFCIVRLDPNEEKVLERSTQGPISLQSLMGLYYTGMKNH